MKKTIGILAHVDAGKTTLSERILYEAQAIRKLGRVDHQDSFMDMDPMERRRGITIFSGQAVIRVGEDTMYLLDTPGHVDFSPEMERALSVLDYAILVVSSAEGVQSHTETLWRLLQFYHVPVFIFLSKTDREGADPNQVLATLRKRLSPDFLDFRSWQHQGVPDDELMEELASRNELLMDSYLEGKASVDQFTDTAARLIASREISPVMAGSALTGEGMDGFLATLNLLTPTAYHAAEDLPFAARVHQIRHDNQGQRICFMKLLQGKLRVKEDLPWGKVNELRIYHGGKYTQVESAAAGDLVAVLGMESLHAGSTPGLLEKPFQIVPMLAADVLWDSKAQPAFKMYQWLKLLEDEEPTLSVQQRGDVLTIHMMGQVQLEILQQLMLDRFGVSISFGPCKVLYRETISSPAIGIGHYEPLRHYAEVHLRLVPTEPGSGITFLSRAHVDDLALNWQRLIETHVFEKAHKGVLTGSPVTDIRIELLCGRAHLKHTEGGDFRQATCRAIRHALMHAQSVLLEPICGYEIRVPQDQFGSVSGALQRLSVQTDPPEFDDNSVVLRGEAPLSRFSSWQTDLSMLTHGKGTLRSWLSRYAPCSEQASVVEDAAYNPLADDTPDSVFCAHGAGYTVPWNEVVHYAHLVTPEV